MTNAPVKLTNLKSFLNPRAIIFAACILNLLVRAMYVRQVELQAQAAIATGQWPYSEHWNPAAVMLGPMMLLIAALGFLINRWWSLLLATVLSGRVIYLLGYLSLTTVHYAFDVPIFSWQAIEKLWYAIYQPQPQHLFEVMIAAAIFISCISLLGRMTICRSRVPATRG
jgi:small-conductance mechanosensitive channel